MQLFRFKVEEGEGFALTADSRGDRLPRDGRVWQAMGAVELEALDEAQLGASRDEVLRQVREAGAYVWT